MLALAPALPRLSLYRVPPTGDVTLDQFEGAALDRIAILSDIERLDGSVIAQKHLLLQQRIRQLFPLESEDDIRRDAMAHYIMRLAFADPKDRDWFFRYETQLFQLRLKEADDASVDVIIKESGISLERLKYDDLNPAVKSDLAAMGTHRSHQYYRVKFRDALYLMSIRSTPLIDGYMYLYSDQIKSVLIDSFKKLLKEALNFAHKNISEKGWDKMDPDNKIVPILKGLKDRASNVDYRKLASPDAISPKDINELSQRSFPPCMRLINIKLRQTHHLKHGARLQYGLFLKGAGLSLDDALIFWRDEFTKKMSLKTFESQHMYNIRHQYGREGRSVDYFPYACGKIIGSKPGPEEDHGCPFRIYDAARIKSTLGPLLMQDVKDVAQLATLNPHAACALYYEKSHPGVQPGSFMVRHPNEYFKRSEQYWKEKKN